MSHRVSDTTKTTRESGIVFRAIDREQTPFGELVLRHYVVEQGPEAGEEAGLFGQEILLLGHDALRLGSGGHGTPARPASPARAAGVRGSTWRGAGRGRRAG